MQQANVDLVRLAVLVFAADRSTPRAVGGTNWSQRDFAISVPVADEKRWTPVAGEIGELLQFLTGDSWQVGFRSARPPKEQVVQHLNLAGPPARVVLMSGGADSALGALESRRLLTSAEGHVLVSHVGASALAPIQRGVAAGISSLAPGPWQEQAQIHLIRRAAQVEGSPFKNEFSTRSRSFLFLALGLAIASIHKVPLWIPENGFASLNPPLAPNRRGSLSTRTTHPAFLGGLSDVLAKVGAQAEIVNPFADRTKGEMFRIAADAFGDDAVSEFLSATHSCGLTGQRAFGLSVTVHCGVCFGCVVRRASFGAAKVVDRTAYASEVDDKRLQAWLHGKSVVPDVRAFVRRGIAVKDLAALSLPADFSMAAARDLCDRASAELREYVM